MSRQSNTSTKSEPPSLGDHPLGYDEHGHPIEGLTEDGELCVTHARVFKPLVLGQHRYQGARGGRGGAKSHFFAGQLIQESVKQHIRCACMREVQNSIKDSVKQLLEDKIAKFNVPHLFDVTDREIRGPNDSLFIFRGLRNHTASSIKSLEGFNRGYVEEAHTISQRSLDLMTPTFRNNAQLRFSWNTNEPTDPVDKMFEENKADPDFCLVHANWDTNPWFKYTDLERDRARDQRRDPEKYQHIWCGGYLKNSEARVFKNWIVDDFDTPLDARFLQGADWGYSVDPTVLIRGFVGRYEGGVAKYDPKGKTLFIDHEAYRVGVELDHTPRFFDQLIKDRGVPVLQQLGVAKQWTIIADSSNPQAISYLRRNGYPKIQAAVKGPGSIKEGITFLQNYDIVVHSRCKYTQDELTHFSYEIDPHTKLVLPILGQKKNHVIDSLRYAVEPLRRPRTTTLFGSY